MSQKSRPDGKTYEKVGNGGTERPPTGCRAEGERGHAHGQLCYLPLSHTSATEHIIPSVLIGPHHIILNKSPHPSSLPLSKNRNFIEAIPILCPLVDDYDDGPLNP